MLRATVAAGNGADAEMSFVSAGLSVFCVGGGGGGAGEATYCTLGLLTVSEDDDDVPQLIFDHVPNGVYLARHAQCSYPARRRGGSTRDVQKALPPPTKRAGGVHSGTRNLPLSSCGALHTTRQWPSTAHCTERERAGVADANRLRPAECISLSPQLDSLPGGMFGSAGVPTRPAGYTGDQLTGRLWNTSSCASR
jgi:hypothetical protein